MLRVGSTLGAVRFRVPRRSARSVGPGARAYADSLVARLRRVLSLTAWERTLDGIRPDGSITPRLALRAFSIAYGPLPGVKRPRGRLGVPQSGTLAMQLVARVWNRLKPAQQAAIERALGAPHGPGSPLTARASAEEEPGQVLTPDPAYQAIVDKYSAYYAQAFQYYGPIVIEVFKASKDIVSKKTGAKILADALPLDTQGEWGTNPPGYCRVRVPPHGQSQPKLFLDLVLAHETFHCFQFVLVPGWASRAAWLIEGTADWAAVTASKAPASVGAGPYKAYLGSTTKPLFARSYDATGFWGYLGQLLGVEGLWFDIRASLNEPTSAASFVRAGGTNQVFVDTWASAAWRLGSSGPAWNQVLPYWISYDNLPLPAAAVTNVVTTGTTLGANEYAMSQFLVVRDPTRPLVNVLSLRGRLRAAAKGDFGVVGSDWFCFGKCTCPPGQVSSIPEHRQVPIKALFLGMTGGAETAQGRVTFHPVSEFCESDKSPPPPGDDEPLDCSSGGCGNSNGDPHLVTFDGLAYDFQAAGEFTLVKSRSGDLEVQARQQPAPTVAGVPKGTVSINTAVAMRVGGSRVGVYATKRGISLRVNGRRVKPPRGKAILRLRGGGALAERKSQLTVFWPEGSKAALWSLGSTGVAFIMGPARSRAGRLVGLLGNFDGRRGNDLATRGGRRFGTRKVLGGRGRAFTLLYRRFGDSWRIRQRDSLFDYRRGRNTRSYTIRAFPRRPLSIGSLPAKLRRRAARICRAAGVRGRRLLNNCILDVAATGNHAFARDANRLEDTAPPPGAVRVYRLTGTFQPEGLPGTGEVSIEVVVRKGRPVEIRNLTFKDLPARCNVSGGLEPIYEPAGTLSGGAGKNTNGSGVEFGRLLQWISYPDNGARQVVLAGRVSKSGRRITEGRLQVFNNTACQAAVGTFTAEARG